MNEFKRIGLDKLVDGHLKVRCANYGYQYSDIMLALFCIYLCGGDHLEDITTILKKYLSTAPGARIPSSDTNKRGYFPGVMTSGPLVIGIENRQGNSNVKLEQVEELTRMLDNVEAHGLYVRMFRADCGSFIKELVEELFLRTETFYLRASTAQRNKS